MAPYPLPVSDPDAELVNELKKEQPGAFEKLFHAYWRKVLTLALTHLPDSAEAEDATIETFTDIARGIKNFRGESKLSTWIYRIALNRIRKHQRTRAKTPQTLPLHLCPKDLAPTPSLEQKQAVKDEISWLLKQIDRLPKLQREVVTLRYLMDLPLSEVSAILRISIEATGMRLHRALNRLRQLRAQRERREGK